MESYSLFQLNEYIKRVMALNFPEPIWIKGEIAQIKESRGSHYLELIEKDEKSGQVIAQASAVIWFKSFLFIKKKLGELADSILSDGTEINVKVRVDFNERYGHKLVIEDIDASYTIGQLEMQRQINLERLKKEGLLDLNKHVDLPDVIQRIAIISSEKAAGYHDFINQLHSNSYNYYYHTTLFQSAMQGRATGKEVAAALLSIQESRDKFDCIVIIRGGGSKLDLSGFDDYNIGYQIANCSLPVITGIGHQIDLSVADIVAHLQLKTPTAVANFLIDRNLHFESDMLNLSMSIQNAIRSILSEEQYRMTTMTETIQSLPAIIIKDNVSKLDSIRQEIYMTCRFHAKGMHQFMKQSNSILTSLDPKNVLKRGYAMVKQDGDLQMSSKKLKKGDSVNLIFKDGKRKAEIL